MQNMIVLTLRKIKKVVDVFCNKNNNQEKFLYVDVKRFFHVHSQVFLLHKVVNLGPKTCVPVSNQPKCHTITMRTGSPVGSKNALLHINDPHQLRDTVRKTTKREDKRAPARRRHTTQTQYKHTLAGKSVKYDRPMVKKVGVKGSHIVTI